MQVARKRIHRRYTPNKLVPFANLGICSHPWDCAHFEIPGFAGESSKPLHGSTAEYRNPGVKVKPKVEKIVGFERFVGSPLGELIG